MLRAPFPVVATVRTVSPNVTSTVSDQRGATRGVTKVRVKPQGHAMVTTSVVAKLCTVSQNVTPTVSD